MQNSWLFYNILTFCIALQKRQKWAFLEWVRGCWLCHVLTCEEKKKKISQCLSTANIGGSFHRSGLSRHGCEHTCTNLRKRRLKRPMSCELGRYTSLSSWSTDLCCSPMPSSIAWKTVSHWDTALDAILGRYRKSIPKKKKKQISWTFQQLAWERF